MAKTIKENLIAFFKVFLAKWLEDFLILSGVVIILATTYKEFGATIGHYTLGGILVFFGLMFAKK